MLKRIITLAVLLLSLRGMAPEMIVTPVPTKVENKVEQVKPNKSKAFMALVKEKITDLGLENSRLVYFQFREESGNGGSNLSTRHNNIMGMKYPSSRKTYAIGKTSDGYAIYKRWEDSLKDYKILQDLSYLGLTERQYLRKLRKVYAVKENYLKNYL